MVETEAQLFKAVSSDNVSLLQQILENGMSPNVADESHNTPLILAAQKGDVEITKILLNYGADVNARDLNGFTPLYYAIYNGHNQTVRFLLEEGALINPETPEADVALLLATSKGHKGVAQLLLDRAIDIWVVNQFGASALHNAAAGGYTDIVELLLKNEKIPSAYTKLIYKRFESLWNSITIPDEPEPFEFLTGVNKEIRTQFGGINSIDFKKRTALHYAAKGGHFETTKYLLSQGAVASIKDKFGNTPLIFAKNVNNPLLIKLLSLQEEKEGINTPNL